jgi:hypothetical protein
MHTQLALNGRLETGPRVGTSDTNDYSAAYGLILSFLDMLKSSEIKCHIIMCCHIAFLVEDQHDRQSPTAQRDMRGFPQTVGRKIGPMIGQFFNHALRAKVIGTSPGRHVIMTASDEYIDLKTTKPLKVQKEYNLETGLAEYFYALRQPPTA